MADETVIVISDADGNLYTITQELLELARVQDEAHKVKIQELIGSEVIGYALPGQLQVVGSYPRPADSLIRRTYFPPTVTGARVVGQAPA